ncbi:MULTISPECIES: group 1 truncated hemoglobin [unclassified Methylophaga]|uniref:group I truncated hemoglobin n=1 Tax=unclassified Methylophaga TaxID=2629249 RepID=UPI000C9579F0|nr:MULTISPECIES: group 1 truncated hemoglobin [unclassified Methylophaga]MAK66040.1 group 1 truncated hemoglobin [Methylophaga sp.]MAY18582.1 group 1 truncated hemoglobin [Methylophaga sp.]MAY18954.1 group 1 truncated hemoglobin [Methylophaga sp.]MBN46348.1 group 1 truncated hemoglobin [Methylophaga sp.]HAO25400.1 group 1 truncated hemoglobin [Methylophaga sp.]|tara:strand:+ start:10681 stop:11109 length:429 start_codon:yes stop_codon:yes gene_type:complete
MSLKYRYSVLVALCLMISACASPPDTTLYKKLGGESGIENIVENLVQEIGQDKQIFHYFAEASVSRFKENLIEHFCAISDGPCKYTGDNMVDIHTGMNINEKDFNHMVDLLINAMDTEGIPHRIQNQLIARLAPLRKEIIYL